MSPCAGNPGLSQRPALARCCTLVHGNREIGCAPRWQRVQRKARALPRLAALAKPQRHDAPAATPARRVRAWQGRPRRAVLAGYATRLRPPPRGRPCQTLTHSRFLGFSGLTAAAVCQADGHGIPCGLDGEGAATGAALAMRYTRRTPKLPPAD